MEKHYSEVPSTWRSFDQICSALGLKKENLHTKLILDLGSGGASFAEEISKHPELSSRVISLDPNYNLDTLSDENRDIMQEAVEGIKKDKLSAVAGLSERLPFKDSIFDLIISNHAIPWHIAYEPEKIKSSLQEIIRVLKQGGEVRMSPIDRRTYKFIRMFTDGIGNCYVESKGDLVILIKNG